MNVSLNLLSAVTCVSLVVGGISVFRAAIEATPELRVGVAQLAVASTVSSIGGPTNTPALALGVATENSHVSTGALPKMDECTSRADCPVGMGCQVQAAHSGIGIDSRCIPDAAEGEPCGQKRMCSPALSCDTADSQGVAVGSNVCRRTCDVVADCQTGECCDASFLCRASTECPADSGAFAPARERVGPAAYASLSQELMRPSVGD